MANLFITLLFPNLSDTQDDNIQPGIPIMNSTTRQEIYSIILLLCQSTNNCAEMLELLEDIIPYGTSFSYLQIVLIY